MLSVDERVKMPPPILASIPSLKFVALNFGGGPLPTFSAHSGGFNPYPALSWWRVVCDHGERQLQAMSADLGSRIAAYLYSPNYNHEVPIDESMFLPNMLEEYKPGRVTVAQALLTHYHNKGVILYELRQQPLAPRRSGVVATSNACEEPQSRLAQQLFINLPNQVGTSTTGQYERSKTNRQTHELQLRHSAVHDRFSSGVTALKYPEISDQNQVLEQGCEWRGARLSTGVAMPVRDNRVQYIHRAGSLYTMIGASGPGYSRARACELVPDHADQSACLRFYPYQDGPTDQQWNGSYTESSWSHWSHDHNLGEGTSSHYTTLVGAYIRIDWTGTGVWIYGTGAQGAYPVEVDTYPEVQGQGDQEGILFSQTNLIYGPHSLKLSVVEPPISISKAEITVGLGAQGTLLQTRTINGVLPGTVTGNPFFHVDNTWSAVNLYGNQSASYPCIATYQSGASLSFTLNETVGFEIYGSDDWMQGLLTVTVTSPGGEFTIASVPDSTIEYSSRSGWTALSPLRYLATGLDRTQTYTVVVKNLGNMFNLASVVVHDAVPSSSSRTSGGPIMTAETIGPRPASLGSAAASSRAPAPSPGTSAEAGIASPVVDIGVHDTAGPNIYEQDAGPLVLPPSICDDLDPATCVESCAKENGSGKHENDVSSAALYATHAIHTAFRYLAE
ncbi:hypothetical protein IEO21_09196 [Rhodonia placenta]|uniref:Uncharacterized protein n=1 Tax=Rhodonia placenta TaxID=104341 RepID=A0A8H7NUW6_9APHY|nr:hypothetical protein IEO21_09196 [Postia placenta]